MKANLTQFIFLYCLALAQNAFFYDFKIFHVVINFYLIYLFWIIFDDEIIGSDGYILAFVGGLIYEIFFASFFGFPTLVFLFVTWLSKTLRKIIDLPFLAFGLSNLLVISFLTAYHFGLYLFWPLGNIFISGLFLTYLQNVFTTFFISSFCYLIYRYVLENLWPKTI